MKLLKLRHQALTMRVRESIGEAMKSVQPLQSLTSLQHRLGLLFRIIQQLTLCQWVVAFDGERDWCRRCVVHECTQYAIGWIFHSLRRFVFLISDFFQPSSSAWEPAGNKTKSQHPRMQWSKWAGNLRTLLPRQVRGRSYSCLGFTAAVGRGVSYRKSGSPKGKIDSLVFSKLLAWATYKFAVEFMSLFQNDLTVD